MSPRICITVVSMLLFELSSVHAASTTLAPAVAKCELGIVLLESFTGPTVAPVPDDVGLRIFRSTLSIICLDTIRVLHETSDGQEPIHPEAIRKLGDLLEWLRNQESGSAREDLDSLTEHAIEEILEVRELLTDDSPEPGHRLKPRLRSPR